MRLSENSALLDAAIIRPTRRAGYETTQTESRGNLQGQGGDSGLARFECGRLLPLCLGVNTIGLTAASEILFSIFPEIALPVEKSQWKDLFQTVDYTDIIYLMRAEISEWEKRSQKMLNECDPLDSFTLPVFYNAAALIGV